MLGTEYLLYTIYMQSEMTKIPEDTLHYYLEQNNKNESPILSKPIKNN